MRPEFRRSWSETAGIANAKWYGSSKPEGGLPLRIMSSNDGVAKILSPDYMPLGELAVSLDPHRRGLLLATTKSGGDEVNWKYLGPDDMLCKTIVVN
jgi:hypothetical protein